MRVNKRKPGSWGTESEESETKKNRISKESPSTSTSSSDSENESMENSPLDENPIENHSNDSIDHTEDSGKKMNTSYRSKAIQKISDALRNGAKDENPATDESVGDREYYAEALEKKMFMLSNNCKSQYFHFIYEKLDQIKKGSLESVLKEAVEWIISQDPKLNSSGTDKIDTNTPFLIKKKLIQLPEASEEKFKTLSPNFTLKIFQEKIFHSEKCKLETHETDNLNQQCYGLACRFMGRILNHFKTCLGGFSCPLDACKFAQKMFLTHWFTCWMLDCQNCRKLSEVIDKVIKNFQDSVDPTTTNGSAPSTSGVNNNQARSMEYGIWYPREPLWVEGRDLGRRNPEGGNVSSFDRPDESLPVLVPFCENFLVKQ